MNPITEGLEFVKSSYGSGSSIGMAKLILSLYNGKHAFAFADCVSAFDRERLDIAARMVANYCTVGEDEALLNAGQYIYEKFPDLIELSNAANDAKADVREKWREADKAKYRDEDEG